MNRILFALSILFIIMKVFLISNWDDVENYVLYQSRLWNQEGLEHLILSAKNHHIDLAYGPLYYVILNFLSQFLNVEFLRILFLILLAFSWIKTGLSNHRLILFLLMPVIFHFTSVVRPDSLCFILSLWVIHSHKKRHYIVLSLTIALICLIKPNFIIFPLLHIAFIRDLNLKPLLMGLIGAISLWLVLNTGLDDILYLGMVQGNLNGFEISQALKLWSSHLGLFSLPIVFYALVQCKHRLLILFCLGISFIMSLKSGSNLNYFMYPIFLLILYSKLSFPKLLSYSIIINLIISPTVLNKQNDSQELNAKLKNLQIKQLCFGPSSLLEDPYFEIKYTDSHIYHTRQSSLPQNCTSVYNINSKAFTLSSLHYSKPEKITSNFVIIRSP